MMMEVEYNGIPGSNFGVYAKNLPTIPPAVKKASSVEIAGRDGTLYLLDGFLPSLFSTFPDTDNFFAYCQNIQQ